MTEKSEAQKKETDARLEERKKVYEEELEGLLEQKKQIEADPKQKKIPMSQHLPRLSLVQACATSDLFPLKSSTEFVELALHHQAKKCLKNEKFRTYIKGDHVKGDEKDRKVMLDHSTKEFGRLKKMRNHLNFQIHGKAVKNTNKSTPHDLLLRYVGVLHEPDFQGRVVTTEEDSQDMAPEECDNEGGEAKEAANKEENAATTGDKNEKKNRLKLLGFVGIFAIALLTTIGIGVKLAKTFTKKNWEGTLGKFNEMDYGEDFVEEAYDDIYHETRGAYENAYEAAYDNYQQAAERAKVQLQ